MCLCFSNGQAFSEASFRSFVWIVRPGNPRETRGRTVTVNVVVLHKEICLVVLKRLLSYRSSSTVVMTSSVLGAFGWSSFFRGFASICKWSWRPLRCCQCYQIFQGQVANACLKSYQKSPDLHIHWFVVTICMSAWDLWGGRIVWRPLKQNKVLIRIENNRLYLISSRKKSIHTKLYRFYRACRQTEAVVVKIREIVTEKTVTDGTVGF